MILSTVGKKKKETTLPLLGLLVMPKCHQQGARCRLLLSFSGVKEGRKVLCASSQPRLAASGARATEAVAGGTLSPLVIMQNHAAQSCVDPRAIEGGGVALVAGKF